jgi:hypothetical protein
MAGIKMSNHRDNILELVSLERERQDKMWGPQHDAKHHNHDWVSFINVYLGRVVFGDGEWRCSASYFEENMVKVAALAIASVEAMYAAYDKEEESGKE